MTYLHIVRKYAVFCACFLACRSRQASIVLERYFRFEISLLSISCMLTISNAVISLFSKENLCHNTEIRPDLEGFDFFYF